MEHLLWHVCISCLLVVMSLVVDCLLMPLLVVVVWCWCFLVLFIVADLMSVAVVARCCLYGVVCYLLLLWCVGRIW